MGYKQLSDEQLDWLTSKTNRSKRQTQFLYEILGGDFLKLKKLEMQLKNCLIFYCPGDLEEVDKIMKLTPKCNLLNLNTF